MRLVMVIHGDGGSLPDNDAWASVAVLSLLYLGLALQRGCCAALESTGVPPVCERWLVVGKCQFWS